MSGLDAGRTNEVGDVDSTRGWRLIRALHPPSHIIMASLSPKSERRSSVLLGRRPSAGHRRGAPSISATSAASTQDGLQALIRQAAAGLDEPALAQTLADLDNPTSSASAFLASLTTQTLKGVESQPQLLASSSKTLDEQLATLCQRHVASLAHVHHSTSALPAAVQSVQGNINDLIEEALPQLTQAAQAFLSQTREALAARQRANELLEAHASTLPDLLDIPDLITSCIRNGNHTEAIRLAAHIAKLARNDSALGGGPILQSLKVRSWVSLQELRDQLLESLQSRSLSLSSAKRIITSLRGLKDLDESSSSSSKRAPPLMLTEPQLCLAFLRARATLLRHTLSTPSSVTKTVTSATPSISHLAAYVDVWRQGVTETCSMAQTLFSGLDVLPQLLAAFLRKHTRLLEVEVEREVRKLVEQVVSSNNAHASSSSSSSQLSRQIDDLASSLLSLHSQLSYAVAALGRLGGDVAPLLAASTGKVLEAAAVELVRVPAQRAVRRFGEQAPSAPGTMPSSWLCEFRDVSRFVSGSDGLADLAPHFAPLARLFNDVVLGLNCLRTFAPLSIRKEALRALDHALVEATTQLNHYCARLPEQQPEGSINGLQLPTLQAGDPEDDDDEGHRQVDALASSAHRLAQAERLLASSAISVLLDALAPRLRLALWRDVFGASEQTLPPLAPAGTEGDEAISTARKWAEDARTAWTQGEEARKVEVEGVKRRRGEERQRLREEDEKREREEAERARREQEEVERRRKEEEEAEKRRKQQEAERLAAEEKKRAAEEAEREERRRREAEAKAKAEEEARRKAEEEAAATEKRRREAEAEEARKKKQAEEEEAARRKKEEDEERAAAAAAEAEAAGKKQQEEEAATKAKADAEARAHAEAQAKAAKEEDDRAAARAKEAAEARAKAEADARAAADAKAKAQSAPFAQDLKQPEAAQTAAMAAQEGPSKAESDAKSGSAPAPSSASVSSSLPSSAAPSPVAGTSDLPSSGAPPAKKMTLAEKLKAKREERERQAAAAAAAAKEAAPESTANEPPQDTPQAAVEGVKSETADQVAAQPPTASVQDQADPAPSSPSAKEEAAAMPSESTQQPTPAPSPPGETPSSSVPASAEASANNSGEESDGGEGGAAANGGNGGSSVDSGIGKGAGGAKKKKKKKGKKK